jgi:hypothetical protein
MKFLKLKRLATSFNIFILVFLGFISGSLTHVNAADSGAVLPISRGGTGANSTSGASANILGENFTNYSGVLPVEKGGTGSNINDTKSLFQAQKNLGLPLSYIYLSEVISKPTYYKFSEEYYGRDNIKEFNALLQISGGGKVSKSTKLFNFYLTGRSHDNAFFKIFGLYPDCSASDNIAFYTKDENDIYKFYYVTEWWSSSVRITWLSYGYHNMYDTLQFTPAVLYEIPSGAQLLYPDKCL